VVDDALAGRLDALSITARTAALAANLPDGFDRRLAALALAFPGVGAAARGGIPPRFTLEELAAAPAGSLGASFHHQVTANGFELEVLEREALGLEALPFPLGYVNARMLQLHDLWHLAAGYELTALHEIGISAFQMAQFGHHYSAMFLALIVTLAAAGPVPGGMVPLVETMARAWRHGRGAPPLLGLDW
jgi:ubiquinone biosynthesis protein Coq4